MYSVFVELRAACGEGRWEQHNRMPACICPCNVMHPTAPTAGCSVRTNVIVWQACRSGVFVELLRVVCAACGEARPKDTGWADRSTTTNIACPNV